MGVGGGVIAQGKARLASISLVVKRADGRVENLGIVSYWHRNIVVRLTMNAWIKLKGLFR